MAIVHRFSQIAGLYSERFRDWRSVLLYSLSRFVFRVPRCFYLHSKLWKHLFLGLYCMNISQLVWSNPDGIARDIELLKNVPIGPTFAFHVSRFAFQVASLLTPMALHEILNYLRCPCRVPLPFTISDSRFTVFKVFKRPLNNEEHHRHSRSYKKCFLVH
jgi:hypothetical protein